MWVGRHIHVHVLLINLFVVKHTATCMITYLLITSLKCLKLFCNFCCNVLTVGLSPYNFDSLIQLSILTCLFIILITSDFGIVTVIWSFDRVSFESIQLTSVCYCSVCAGVCLHIFLFWFFFWKHVRQSVEVDIHILSVCMAVHDQWWLESMSDSQWRLTSTSWTLMTCNSVVIIILSSNNTWCVNQPLL